MDNTTVLLVGCYQRTEFDSAVRSLRQVASLIFAADSQEALSRAREMPIPDVVVLVQSRPGQISDQSVRLLQQAWPLSQFVALLGSWCEGETRTGKPWPDIPRVYSHQWLGRLRSALGGQTLLDLSGLRDELSNTNSRPSMISGRLIAVYARGFSYAEALGEALAAAGCSVVCLTLGEHAFSAGVAIVLYEVNRDPEGLIEDLDKLRCRHPGAQVVAIGTFPRAEEIDELRKKGVAVVVSQPFRVDDLVHQLGALDMRVPMHAEGQPAA